MPMKPYFALLRPYWNIHVKYSWLRNTEVFGDRANFISSSLAEEEEAEEGTKGAFFVAAANKMPFMVKEEEQWRVLMRLCVIETTPCIHDPFLLSVCDLCWREPCARRAHLRPVSLGQIWCQRTEEKSGSLDVYGREGDGKMTKKCVLTFGDCFLTYISLCRLFHYEEVYRAT